VGPTAKPTREKRGIQRILAKQTGEKKGLGDALEGRNNQTPKSPKKRGDKDVLGKLKEKGGTEQRKLWDRKWAMRNTNVSS